MPTHTMNYPRRRAPIACNFCRQRKRKCDGRKPACSLCSGAGISCDYQEVHPGHSSPRNDDGSNSNSRDNGQTSSSASSKTMADLQRMLGQLESLVRWQSTLLEQQQTQLQSMKHSQPLPASSSPKVPADTTVITAPTTTARASVSSSGSLCGDNDTCDMSDVGDMGGADNTDDTLHDIGAQTEITNGSAAVDTPGLFSSSLPVLPPLLFATTGHNSHDVDSMAAPLHHTSGSPEMMDHDGGRAMNNGNIGNNGDNSNNSKNDGNDNNDNNNSNDNDDDDEEEPLTIPVGHLTPRGSLFVLEPIQKLIGEYPEDYFLQIEALRVYHPTCRRRYSHGTHANHGWPGHGLGGALSGLCLDKNYTDMLVAAFFTNVQPHYPIVDADSFMPFVDRVLGQQHTAWMEDPMQSEDDAEIDVALCLTVLALGQLVHRQDHPENGVGISPMSTTAGVGMEAPEAIEPTDDSESYFAIAYEILMRRWATCFKPSVAYASALVHGAIYLCYLDRPLPAWALVHMASIKLQTIVVQLKGHPMPRDETDYVVRLCWTCFLLECDALAEFHLPRSGMELIIDSMPFPSFTDNGHDVAGRSGMMFLAMCSIRRLLNRVHKTVYDANYKARTMSSSSSRPRPGSRNDPVSMSMGMSTSMSLSTRASTTTPPMASTCPLWPPMTTPDMTAASITVANPTTQSPSASTSTHISSSSSSSSFPSLSFSSFSSPTTFSTIESLKAVCTELISQLDVWFDSLPPSIKPDLANPQPRCLQEGWLRLRYWSAKHIICRPCLVFAASYRTPENYSSMAAGAGFPDYVLRLSQTCIEGCRQYILMAAYQLRERTQYTWMTMQSVLACAFVITIAARSPLLRFLVPDATRLLQQALVSTQRWATPGSSAESIGWILNMILQKERMKGGQR